MVTRYMPGPGPQQLMRLRRQPSKLVTVRFPSPALTAPAQVKVMIIGSKRSSGGTFPRACPWRPITAEVRRTDLARRQSAPPMGTGHVKEHAMRRVSPVVPSVGIGAGSPQETMTR